VKWLPTITLADPKELRHNKMRRSGESVASAFSFLSNQLEAREKKAALGKGGFKWGIEELLGCGGRVLHIGEEWVRFLTKSPAQLATHRPRHVVATIGYFNKHANCADISY